MDILKSKKLILIVVFAGILRLAYAYGLPLSGDEAGIGVLQATGKMSAYMSWKNRILKGAVPAEEIKKFILFSKDYSLKDIFRSLSEYDGMHPPFYYILLHYLLKYFGNGALSFYICGYFSAFFLRIVLPER